jgi:hypothetical protein
VTARALAALAAVALTVAAPARGEDPSPPLARLRVGLERLRASGISPALAEAVEARVCAALADASRADVVCPADVEAAAVLAKNAATFGECPPDECMKRVEAVQRADQRVSGTLERGGKGLVLSLQLTRQDGPGPKVVEQLPEDLDGIAARVPGAVKKLFP